ncbi:hypothetical protein [Paludisphaera sp.]|uniref:hypothetical protein n=1 Tax=Paludisphaera sp. TaxID=2017432 RepID=UPI00301DD55C
MSRIDVEVYNEAGGFTIASAGLCGRDLAGVIPGDERWMAAVADGVFMPIELAQDDPIVIRVVVDDPLTDPERDEWVARVRHRLSVPDGRLLIMGGACEYFDGEDMEEYSRTLDIPAGDYQAEVYTYLHGANGDYALDQAGPPEAVGAYFRRTRPGEPFPGWLRAECRDRPGVDPGHEDEWRDAGDDAEGDRPRFLHFLLRLSPDRGEPGPPPDTRGWYSAGAEARRPARCPLGIPASL